ncbi:MAG: hypothetical protein HQL69_02560 [Magnetococcales bacterium]|nr:hypothetical protein [Magnetococcales bacterium]
MNKETTSQASPYVANTPLEALAKIGEDARVKGATLTLMLYIEALAWMAPILFFAETGLIFEGSARIIVQDDGSRGLTEFLGILTKSVLILGPTLLMTICTTATFLIWKHVQISKVDRFQSVKRKLKNSSIVFLTFIFLYLTDHVASLSQQVSYAFSIPVCQQMVENYAETMEDSDDAPDLNDMKQRSFGFITLFMPRTAEELMSPDIMALTCSKMSSLPFVSAVAVALLFPLLLYARGKRKEGEYYEYIAKESDQIIQDHGQLEQLRLTLESQHMDLVQAVHGAAIATYLEQVDFVGKLAQDYQNFKSSPEQFLKMQEGQAVEFINDLTFIAKTPEELDAKLQSCRESTSALKIGHYSFAPSTQSYADLVPFETTNQEKSDVA